MRISASEPNNRSREAGFSLIEIVVAILILAFITSNVWFIINRSLTIQERTRSRDERNHEVHMAIEKIGRDITMAFLSRNRSPDTRTKTVFFGRNSGESDRLDFDSVSHFKILYDAAEGDQCELSYFLQSGEDDTFVLIRREQVPIDADVETGGTETPFLEGVTSLNFRYYDPRRNEWLEDWNSDSLGQQERLPSRVEVTLSYLNDRGNPDKLRTVVPVHMMDPLGG